MKKIISFLPFLSLIFVLFTTTSCAIVGVGAMGGALMMTEERRLAGQVLNDQILEYQVNEAIYAELRGQSDVEVTSYNGVVLLTGEANSQTTIKKITDLVFLYARDNVEIVNELMIGQPTVFSEKTKDTILTAKVKSILLTEIADKQAQNSDEVDNIDYGVLSFSLKIVTHRSVVYLLGILTKPEQEFAKDIVSRIKGVKKVVSIFQDWDRLQEKQRQRIGNVRFEQVKQAEQDRVLTSPI